MQQDSAMRPGARNQGNLGLHRRMAGFFLVYLFVIVFFPSLITTNAARYRIAAGARKVHLSEFEIQFIQVWSILIQFYPIFIFFLHFPLFDRNKYSKIPYRGRPLESSVFRVRSSI